MIMLTIVNIELSGASHKSSMNKVISSEKPAQSVMKVGGDQIGLVPKPSKVGGTRPTGSHNRVVAPMPLLPLHYLSGKSSYV